MLSSLQLVAYESGGNPIGVLIGTILGLALIGGFIVLVVLVTVRTVEHRRYQRYIEAHPETRDPSASGSPPTALLFPEDNPKPKTYGPRPKSLLFPDDDPKP